MTKTLYTYSGESKAGDTNRQLCLNLWWVVSPSGSKITAAPQRQSTPVY